MNYKRNILITGGAGFIGSHLIRLLVTKYPDYRIVNLDKLTYAGNLENLADIDSRPNYVFVQADINDYEAVENIIRHYNIDGIIHLAAESHVDRSIDSPRPFIDTNIGGTFNLLEAARRYWEESPSGYEGKRFYHISTDEVYGALDLDRPQGEPSPMGNTAYGTKFFTEDTPYAPRSPYSASKAASNHLVDAYHHTYGMPTIVTSCSNNYGPNQFPEKLIPLFINNICQGRELPVYGKGDNVRDWLFVEDHARAIDIIFHNAAAGSRYNIGGFNEWKNIDLIKALIKIVDELRGLPEGHSLHLIKHVTDRKGHDMRYAIDSRRLSKELGWQPSLQFEQGLRKTVQWYLDNAQWLQNVTSGEYRNYYEKMYNSASDK